MQARLEGRENRALGAIKEVVFEEPDLPDERETALEVLEGMKEEVLGGEATTDDDASQKD